MPPLEDLSLIPIPKTKVTFWFSLTVIPGDSASHKTWRVVPAEIKTDSNKYTAESLTLLVSAGIIVFTLV